MLQEFHETPIGGHAGVERTFMQLSASFYWEGMRKDVKDYVSNCVTCQTVKYSTAAPSGLLQPLEVPERVWEDLALDFIVGMPNSKGHTTILVVIDRLTKYTHLGPCRRTIQPPRSHNFFAEWLLSCTAFHALLSQTETPFLLASFGRSCLS